MAKSLVSCFFDSRCTYKLLDNAHNGQAQGMNLNHAPTEVVSHAFLFKALDNTSACSCIALRGASAIALRTVRCVRNKKFGLRRCDVVDGLTAGAIS